VIGEDVPGFRPRYLSLGALAFAVVILVGSLLDASAGSTTPLASWALLLTSGALVLRDPQYRAWNEQRRRQRSSTR
jgi:hypothetical protein